MSLSKTTLSKGFEAFGTGMGYFGDVMSGVYFLNDYKEARNNGNSVPVSLAKGATSFYLGELLGLKYLLISGVQAAAQGMVMAGEHTSDVLEQSYNRRGKLGSGYFNMNQAGYTMRQRSLTAIRNNGMNIQSALGNEARTYYRGN